MAKFIRIKNKGLRYAVSSIVLLVIIAAVVGAAFGICFGIGYGLDAKEIDWFGKLTRTDDADKGIIHIFLAGMMTLVGLYILGCIGFGFFYGVKGIGNEWFNSIGDKKEADEKSEA